MERVITYIDGFNLYYGMKAKGWRRYYWLNLQQLAANLLKPGQSLETTKYFTARISAGGPQTPPALKSKMTNKWKRQSAYLEALGTLTHFQIFYGHYLGKIITCQNCKNTWQTHEEKMTDVCIGTELLLDAFRDGFDTAILVSGDSDLVPPVEAVRRYFPAKRIVVAFPPERISMRLKQSASAFFTIGEAKLRQSQFPDQVVKPDGFVLNRPPEW